jgi:NAD(P)-dependent dehydrogenase (short-subunit alcohol dehydrogenase family)
VIVTGAAQGIGEATARRCAEEGARLVLVDIDPAVEGVAAELDAIGVTADLTEPDRAEATVQLARERLHGLEGLVNAAGVHRDGAVADTSDETWSLVLDVNLVAPFRWSRAALPLMLEAGGGAIVNIASIGATHTRPRSAAYSASKAGLLGLTRAIAIDYGRRGVRCNAVSPGSIETGFLKSYTARNPAEGAKLIDLNYVGRFGTPEEIAALTAYLLSDEAGFVNGTEVVVDGGRTVAG